MSYLDFLEVVAERDVAGLRKAEESYGDSWKKRGGVGAFMMLGRKWDRIEKQVEQPLAGSNINNAGGADTWLVAPAYDIFEHIREDTRPEGIMDDIRDLRRYLILVEAEMMARGSAPREQEHPFGHEEDPDE